MNRGSFFDSHCLFFYTKECNKWSYVESVKVLQQSVLKDVVFWPRPWQLVTGFWNLSKSQDWVLSQSLSLLYPCQYRHKLCIAKTRFWGLHLRCRKYWRIFKHFYVIRPKATKFGEIRRRLGLLCRSRSSKVTEFGTNRKPICNFLLVINTNLAPILHRFWDSVR